MKKILSVIYSILFIFSLSVVCLFPASAEAAISATFNVDMTKYVQTGTFNCSSHKVYLCGSFNSWEKNIEMQKDASGFIYRASIQVEKYSYYEYKYFITSPGAPNGGLEDSVGAAGGKRFMNFLGFDKVLPTDYFNNEEPSSSRITITSPSAGTIWPAGSVQNISWNSTGISNLKLEYTNDGGQTWNTIIASVPASNGKFTWNLPDKVLYEWRVRLSDASSPADVKYSSGFFVTFSNVAASVAPLLKIEYPVFQYPLNIFYPPTTAADEEVINGRVGNACGPTVVANILRFWEFPRKGTGSRIFSDQKGCLWSADFQNTIYDYDRMPPAIPQNAPDSVYRAAAVLMYHSGVGMHNFWRTGGGDGIVEAMHEYFNYSRKAKFIERINYTPEQWMSIVKSELSAGRPLMSAGPGHWFIVDGYTKDNLFHVRWDYGEASNQYLPLYEFKPHEGSHLIFAYLEPELNGRRLHLTYPNGGDNLQAGKTANIKWESTGVSNVTLEYSTNNGYDWILFADNIPAASGSYAWNINAAPSVRCRVRISAKEDINIYDRSDDVFSLYDTKILKLVSPVHTYLQSGAFIPLRWQSKGIPSVVIHYSSDMGTTWNYIGENSGASGLFNWIVPEIVSDKCIIKISDKSDPSFAFLSSTFSIGKTSVAGGPYIYDDNTVALMHFDNNHNNEHSTTFNSLAFNNISFAANFDLGLDYCLRIDNSGTTSSAVNIPDYNAVDLSTDWTIELWFKISSWGSGITAYPSLLAKPGKNYFIILNATGKTLDAGYDYEGGSDIVSLPQNCLAPGKWFHLTLIRNTSTYTLKCLLTDSTRQLTAAASAAFNPAHTPKISSGPIGLGGTALKSNIQFDGFIDEVRISNVARNTSSVSLVSPGAGEKLRAGSLYNIKWSAAGVLKVKLEHSTNNGQTWTPFGGSIDAKSGSYQWIVPNSNSKFCRLRISDQIDVSVSDTCNYMFTIIPAASVSVASPNGGEIWQTGTEQFIKWNAAGIDSVKIEFCPNTGSSWQLINKACPADSGTYKWIIPSVSSTKCVIRISDVSDTSVYDNCDGMFSINNSTSSAGSSSAGIPEEYFLSQNFPNPFNPVTAITFGIASDGHVSLIVYDVLGHKIKELVNEFRHAGLYQADFNASELPSGTYIYKLQCGGYSQTRKLILLK